MYDFTEVTDAYVLYYGGQQMLYSYTVCVQLDTNMMQYAVYYWRLASTFNAMAKHQDMCAQNHGFN